MTGYYVINLDDFIEVLGEVDVKERLLEYSCEKNKDVEYFLRNKAIEFSKQGLSKTYLVFTSYKGIEVLVGYFTISVKTLIVSKKALSNSLRTRIRKFAQVDKDNYILSANLIAQLGKNDFNDYGKLITGDELLSLAMDFVNKIKSLVGLKVVYLECEDKTKLIDFYKENGFVEFNRRKKDKDEVGRIESLLLVQMMRYLE